MSPSAGTDNSVTPVKVSEAAGVAGPPGSSGILLAGGAASLVECRLLTGRTHQIRVHLSDRGHPVIGDPLYGRGGLRLDALPAAARTTVQGLTRQALHAETLAFDHPTKPERLRFHSQLPEDIKGLICSLETL